MHAQYILYSFNPIRVNAELNFVLYFTGICIHSRTEWCTARADTKEQTSSERVPFSILLTFTNNIFRVIVNWIFQIKLSAQKDYLYSFKRTNSISINKYYESKENFIEMCYLIEKFAKGWEWKLISYIQSHVKSFSFV